MATIREQPQTGWRARCGGKPRGPSNHLPGLTVEETALVRKGLTTRREIMAWKRRVREAAWRAEIEVHCKPCRESQCPKGCRWFYAEAYGPPDDWQPLEQTK